MANIGIPGPVLNNSGVASNALHWKLIDGNIIS